MPSPSDENSAIRFPLKAASGAAWESECQRIATAEMEKRLKTKIMENVNGQRFTCWRICVEKKRNGLAHMLGVTLPLLQMPDDIKTKVLEFLPKTSSGGIYTTAAELQKNTKARRVAVADMVAGLMIKDLVKKAEVNARPSFKFPVQWMTEELVGDAETWQVVRIDWHKMPELQARLQKLGYHVTLEREFITISAAAR